MIAADLTEEEKLDYVLVMNVRRNQGRNTQRPSGRPSAGVRLATPPRDIRDTKCANCGGLGHTAPNCKKAKVPLEERRCHNCNQPGHIAAKCPEKGKPKPNVASAS